MPVEITSNIEELSKSIEAYIRVSGKSVEQALKKQAAKLGYNIRVELRSLMPAKGSIRSQLLARLKSGQGLRVRPSVLQRVFAKRGARSNLGTGTIGFGKSGRGTTSRGLNIWALAVQAEINLRESARGFLGVSALYAGTGGEIDHARAVSRFGPVLSKADYNETPEERSVTFQWGSFSELSSSAAAGISKPRGDAAINRALRGTIEDIETYLVRKLGENWNG